MRFRRCGWDAVMVEVDSPDEMLALDEVLGLEAAIRAARLPGVVEAVPGGRTVLVRFDPAVTSREAVERGVRGLVWSPGAPVQGELVTIPVVYDGPDLADVAAHVGASVAEVVARHTGSSYAVAFVGFAPGFAYLVGGDPTLRVARRAQPRVRVPAGSVALAGPYCGIYPRPGPGGWQLLGTTSITLWDTTVDPPARLSPGTRVRFMAVG